MLLHSRVTVVTHASVVSPSSVRPHTPFSQSPSSRLMPNLLESISRPFFVVVVFQNFAFLIFYIFFFVNMGSYWRKTSNDIFWNYITDSLKKKMLTSRESLYQSCIKIGEISNFGFVPIFFVFVNMGPYGRKTSNDILSESAQQICSQKSMHTPRKGVYQSYIENFVKFQILDFWQFFVVVLFWDV